MQATGISTRTRDKDPDKDVKLEVARRKGVLFAVILERCVASTPVAITNEDNPALMEKETDAAVSYFERCLEREEKVGLELGNSLREPPQPSEAPQQSSSRAKKPAQ